MIMTIMIGVGRFIENIVIYRRYRYYRYRISVLALWISVLSSAFEVILQLTRYTNYLLTFSYRVWEKWIIGQFFYNFGHFYGKKLAISLSNSSGYLQTLSQLRCWCRKVLTDSCDIDLIMSRCCSQNQIEVAGRSSVHVTGTSGTSDAVHQNWRRRNST